MERKLATIRTIKEILPHPNGDAIELAIVDGWQAIVKKGDFQAGDTVVYFEIDSWVPTTIASFLSNGKTPRVFNGVSGERLRTKRLRGELSQGLVMHATHEVLTGSYYQQALNFNPGMDVTELFGIQKWERKLPACLTGIARGNFPDAIPKTAEARCQNLRMLQHVGLYEMTEKLHGSSGTFYLEADGNYHVCSRNLDLKESKDNAYWRASNKFEIERVMRDANLLGYAIQGEVIGEGINGNQYGVELEFYVFNVFNTATKQYLLPTERRELVEKLGLKHAPYLGDYEVLNHTTSAEILTMADGVSELNGSIREGIVFKCLSRDQSFKAVSNEWLLNGGE